MSTIDDQRLAEIRERLATTHDGPDGIADDAARWLMAEVMRLRAQMRALTPESRSYLQCDACHRSVGPYRSYEEWEDAARSLGWELGEEHLICDTCRGLGRQ